MTTTASTPQTASSVRGKPAPGDKVFKGFAVGAGVVILVVLAAVAIFLIAESVPAFMSDPETNPILDGRTFVSYVWPFIFGTLWSAALALLMATPVAIGIALFISHYAPRKLASVLGYVIDLLAAVPSVVFGLWGGIVLAPLAQPLYSWLVSNLGFIPIFAGPVSATGRTIMTASIVLAVMVLPIITALTREVFLQAPRLHEEAALALGATRFEMIQMAVFPYARPGIVSAMMLGLGRALGETMAVTMVLSISGAVTFDLLTSTNPGTIAANIALNFPEAYGEGINVLIATGLVLFIVTFAVNAVARFVVNRRKDFSGAN
jgi:phosphate transport system permease protein